MEALDALAVRLGPGPRDPDAKKAGSRSGAREGAIFRLAFRITWRCRPQQAITMAQVHKLGAELGMAERTIRRALLVLEEAEFVAYRYDKGSGSGRLIVLEVERRMLAKFGLKRYRPASLRGQTEILYGFPGPVDKSVDNGETPA